MSLDDITHIYTDVNKSYQLGCHSTSELSFWGKSWGTIKRFR